MIHNGEIIERGGYRFRVDYEHDNDHEPPWEDGDGRGIVREARMVREKKPGERLLQRSQYMQSAWLFDWQGTIAKAKEEGWGLNDDDLTILKLNLGRVPTKGEITAYAVEREFQLFRQYLNDDWWYVGIVITLIPEGADPKRVELDYSHAMWGFANYDKIYLEDEAERMIEEYVGELDRNKAEERAASERAAALNHGLAYAAADLMEWLHRAESAPIPPEVGRELFDEVRLLRNAAGI